MEDVIHPSHPDCCIIITLCDICCCMWWTSFDTFILFLKIIYSLKCAVFMAGVEERARHLMPKIKRHDLQQIHWR